MATVANSMSWAADGVALKRFLGLQDDAEDALLRRWLAVAIEAADAFLENGFTDADGVDLPLPEGVREGVFVYVKALRERRGAVEGVSAVTTQEHSETNDAAYTGDLALRAAGAFWGRYMDGEAVLLK